MYLFAIISCRSESSNLSKGGGGGADIPGKGGGCGWILWPKFWSSPSLPAPTWIPLSWNSTFGSADSSIIRRLTPFFFTRVEDLKLLNLSKSVFNCSSWFWRIHRDASNFSTLNPYSSFNFSQSVQDFSFSLVSANTGIVSQDFESLYRPFAW